MKDRSAFKYLFATFHRQLCYFALKIIKDSCEAEDIVQEIFMSLWKGDFEEFTHINALRNFLYRSVQNRCLNYIRNQKIRTRNYKNLQEKDPIDEDDFLCRQIQAEVIAEIFEAIQELPEKCREVFTLFYIEELEDKEIAEQLNISVTTIRTQKQRAKSYLRSRLGDLFVIIHLLFPGF